MTKKDLQEQIDRLSKRIDDLEQRPQFGYMPQVPYITYTPSVTINDPLLPNPYLIWGGTNQAADANVRCYNSESTQEERFGSR